LSYKALLPPLLLLFLAAGELLFKDVWAKRVNTSSFTPFSVVMNEELRQQSWRGGAGELVNSTFQSRLDRLSDSAVIHGNQMEMLINGMMSYPTRYRMIDLAQKSIILTTLSINGGDSKREIKDQSVKKLVERLILARKRGVRVFLIYDGFSSYLNNSEVAVSKLKEAGVELIKYNPMISSSSDRLWRKGIRRFFKLLGRIIHNRKLERHFFTNRWHEKSIVIDGRYALIGGINWGDHYGFGNMYSAQEYPLANFLANPLMQELGVWREFQDRSNWSFPYRRGWRDNDLLIKGPMAYSMHRRLLRDFLMLKEGEKRRRHRFEYFDQQMIERAEERMGGGEYRFSDLVLPLEIGGFATGVKGQMRYISQRPKIYTQLPRVVDLPRQAEREQLYVSKEFPESTITNYYINIINRARHQILWGTFSFHLTDDMLEALKGAAQRGVKIYLITNSRASAKYLDDSGRITYRRGKRRYKKLIRAGYVDGQRESNIRIFEWQGSVERGGKKLYSGAYHSKNFSVDGVLTSVGSYNMTRASSTRHVEGVVVVLDPDFNRKQQEMFTRDLSYTREVRIKKRRSR
jgi:cardiolipin synthase C